MKVLWLVADGLGIGHAPDAEVFGCKDANTLAHVVDRAGIAYLASKGLLKTIDQSANGEGVVARMVTRSVTTDTLSGHWEMAGRVTTEPVPFYPEGFPRDMVDSICKIMGVDGVLANCAMNGQKAIDEYGAEHLRTGFPILYTSSDSVLQLAVHTSVWSLDKLHSMCAQVRTALAGKNAVGRVIARPFTGSEGHFSRLTEGRRDWGLEPPTPTVLDLLLAADVPTIGVGKIGDIFSHRGLSEELHPSSSTKLLSSRPETKADVDLWCLEAGVDALQSIAAGLVYVNLVAFDSVFGHVRDVTGYRKHLNWLSAALSELEEGLGDTICILSGDHGNDPSFPGSDHTRERTPLLMWGKALKAADLEELDLSSIGKSVGSILGVDTSNLEGSDFSGRIFQS